MGSDFLFASAAYMHKSRREFILSPFNISFDINGAIGNTPENITVKNGESVKLPVILNAVKPGFIFNGWTYEDGKLADNIIKCEGKDIKLVASWKKVTADVSIDEINSEYSNVSEVVGKINVKSSETVSVKVNVRYRRKLCTYCRSFYYISSIFVNIVKKGKV